VITGRKTNLTKGRKSREELINSADRGTENCFATDILDRDFIALYQSDLVELEMARYICRQT